MVHHQHTPRPRGVFPPRSPLRRLATHALWALAVAVGLTLALAVVVSRMISSAGQAHRGASSPTAAARRSGPTHPGDRRAGDPPGARSTAPPAGGLSTASPRGTPVSVSVAARPEGPAVPADFLGLSFEVRSLPAIAGYATRGDLVALLRSLGPGVMRFGGISADEQAAWVANGAARPGWARVAIDEADLAGLASLARETGWRVLLTVNLGHYDPTAAALEAAAAQRLLGSNLAGIEIGNEPDLLVRKHLRGPGWGIVAYAPQARAYRAGDRGGRAGDADRRARPLHGVAGLELAAHRRLLAVAAPGAAHRPLLPALQLRVPAHRLGTA